MASKSVEAAAGNDAASYTAAVQGNTTESVLRSLAANDKATHADYVGVVSALVARFDRKAEKRAAREAA